LATKSKVLNVNKLKLFLQELTSEKDTTKQELNFNNVPTDGPITRACAKLINYKMLLIWHYKCYVKKVKQTLTLCVMNPALHVTLRMTISSSICHRENKNCSDCDKFAKLFLKLKECKDQCKQLKNLNNFACQHQHHQNIYQI
jgi:hypothetical protein